MAKKGRNTDLLEQRNAKICERFAYWYEVQKVRLDETLRILSEEEFFLSQRYLWRIISEQKGVLSEEALEKVRKPRIRAVRGIPSSVKAVAEFQWTPLFPQ